MAGNKLQDVLAGVNPDEQTSAAELVRSPIENRGSALSRIASGAQAHSIQEKIDPGRCRPWQGNARHYERLTREDCQDLIDGLISEQRQLIPAVARRLKDDPHHDFEIIVGLRRLWSIAWLRANNYPDFLFIIEVKELTDEQAFRLQDQENRTRKDVSDYERAQSYLNALGVHYGGSQIAMAKRLEVDSAWLSRLLTLARLPHEIIDAYDDPRAITLNAVTQLGPLLNSPAQAKKLLAEATKIASSKPHGLLAKSVTKSLLSATEVRKPVPQIKSIKSPGGKTWINIKRGRAGVVDIRLSPVDGKSISEALQRVLEELTS